MTVTRPFTVRRKWMATPDVAALELVPADGGPLPALDAGAHIEFVIERAGQPPLIRHYSLCNAPGETDALVFGIKREPRSRGGSAWIHARMEGDQIRLGAVRNLFPLSADAQSHLLLAGGIGITPILAMAQRLALSPAAYEVHYFVRGHEHVAFRERLVAAERAGRLHIHAGLGADEVKQVLCNLLSLPAEGAHAYCCGPGVFMDTVAGIAELHWPQDRMHFERFQAAAVVSPADEAPFEVQLAHSGLRCTVQPGQTIVQALGAAGCEVLTSCEQGVCGTCMTKVLDGTPEHRDAFLNKAEREAGQLIMPCVSRSKTPLLVLDL